mmetsp:Transcript_24271/g.67223  ORF Transcript_24271/g.67223 Transcript_24271/m.67223 type:complete len:109 (+) Transcript_24271:243-569(+)
MQRNESKVCIRFTCCTLTGTYLQVPVPVRETCSSCRMPNEIESQSPKARHEEQGKTPSSKEQPSGVMSPHRIEYKIYVYPIRPCEIYDKLVYRRNRRTYVVSKGLLID